MSIEPKTNAIPIAVIKSDDWIFSLFTNDDVVQNARLNNSAPNCFDALNVKVYVTPKVIGESRMNGAKIFPKYDSKGNK